MNDSYPVIDSSETTAKPYFSRNSCTPNRNSWAGLGSDCERSVTSDVERYIIYMYIYESKNMIVRYLLNRRSVRNGSKMNVTTSYNGDTHSASSCLRQVLQFVASGKGKTTNWSVGSDMGTCSSTVVPPT